MCGLCILRQESDAKDDPARTKDRFIVSHDPNSRGTELRFAFMCPRCGGCNWHASSVDDVRRETDRAADGSPQGLTLSRGLERITTCSSCGRTLKVRVAHKGSQAKEIADARRGQPQQGAAAAPAHGSSRHRAKPALAQVAALAMQTDQEAMEEVQLIQRAVQARLLAEAPEEAPGRPREDEEEAVEHQDKDALVVAAHEVDLDEEGEADEEERLDEVDDGVVLRVTAVYV